MLCCQQSDQGLQAADLIAYQTYKIETAYSVSTLDAAVDDVETVKTVRCAIVRASITAGVPEEHKNDLLILEQFKEQFFIAQGALAAGARRC